ncbi:hypothetical protein [Microbacterium sp. P01]|uniref:hypothetical protein n=1 Tax=unclassified Microbacterium TaxID=2609290 RepID=UPI0036716CD1
MPEPSGVPVRPGMALVFSLVGFFALAIFGFGMTSLITDSDVIAVEGLGPIPGVFALVCAAGGFAGSLWLGIRSVHPSYVVALPVAIASFLFYLVGLGFGALVGDAGLVQAVAAVGGVATSWFGMVVAVTGLVCAAGGVALVRPRTARPHWPWENGDE